MTKPAPFNQCSSRTWQKILLGSLSELESQQRSALQVFTDPAAQANYGLSGWCSLLE